MTSEKKGDIVRKPRANKNYVNGPDFYIALVDYNKKLKETKEAGTPSPQISRYIGECIIQIAENLGKKINFAAYSFRQEMVSDAIEKMIECVDKYDVEYNKEKPNPFAYFSQISWNIFLQRIAKEKKEQYLKHKNFDRLYSHEFLENEDALNNEEHNRVIEEFESKKEKNNDGYAKHSNLSYVKKPKKEIENVEPENSE